MIGKVFLDTNTLTYAYDLDAGRGGNSYEWRLEPGAGYWRHTNRKSVYDVAPRSPSSPSIPHVGPNTPIIAHIRSSYFDRSPVAIYRPSGASGRGSSDIQPRAPSADAEVSSVSVADFEWSTGRRIWV